MAACVWAFCVKFVAGRLIGALVREDACDGKSALTLSQLGCKGFLYRFALRKGTTLSEAVPFVSEDDAEKRYYLKPEAKEKMLQKYGEGTKGLMSLVLTLLAALIAAAVIAALIPTAVKYLGL